MNFFQPSLTFSTNVPFQNHLSIHALIFSWIAYHASKLIEAKFSIFNEVDQWAATHEGKKVSIINYLERRSS